MPFVQVYKAAKPAWQDTRPSEPQLRDAYAIAARHETIFARAYLQLARSMLADPKVRRDLLRALAGDSVEAAVDVLPWFDPIDPNRTRRWQRYASSLMRAYDALVEEAGVATLDSHDLAVRFILTKDVDSDINPFRFSLTWIQERAGELIREVSESQKKAVRRIIFESFSRGERPKEILDRIARIVGLLESEAMQVDRRLNSALAAGIAPARARADADRFSNTLLRRRSVRIARTETIEAQNQGILDAWRQASEAGLIEPGTEREWVAASESERTCPICGSLAINGSPGLDGTRAPLDQPFHSEVLGRPVMRPPAHPQCRCTVILVFPGDEDEDEDQPRRVLTPTTVGVAVGVAVAVGVGAAVVIPALVAAPTPTTALVAVPTGAVAGTTAGVAAGVAAGAAAGVVVRIAAEAPTPPPVILVFPDEDE